MPAPRKLAVPVLTVAALLGSASLLTAGWTAAAADPGDGVPWRTDAAAAAAEAARTGKPMLLSFTGAWCVPCVQMDRHTWPDARVRAALEERFIPVRVDLDDDPETAAAYRVVGIPALLIEQGDELSGRVDGYRTPGQVLAFLNRHAPAPPAE